MSWVQRWPAIGHSWKPVLMLLQHLCDEVSIQAPPHSASCGDGPAGNSASAVSMPGGMVASARAITKPCLRPHHSCSQKRRVDASLRTG